MKEKIFIIITKINFRKSFPTLLLLLPPLIFCTAWYLFDYEERAIFNNIEVKGSTLSLSSDKEMSILSDLTDALYDYTKNDYPVQFEKTKGASEFEDFKSEVSEKLTEIIGVFSSLPIYKVCLVNHNVVSIGGEIQDNLDSSKSAASIKQENGYEFYAPRGGKDCKNVVIGKFRNSRSRADYGYVVSTISNTEDGKFSVRIATSSVDASGTKIVISLSVWVLLLSYFLTLFAWSFIFFQYEKIYNYIFRGGSK